MAHIYSGRFVMSVGWGRRIDVYLVSIKAQGEPAFPFHISGNSPDGTHKKTDCCDPLSSTTLLFIAVQRISIFHLLNLLHLHSALFLHFAVHNNALFKAHNTHRCDRDIINDYVHQVCLKTHCFCKDMSLIFF